MTNETMKEALTEAQKEKLDRLRENIRSLGSLAVGFSGGRGFFAADIRRP